MPNCLIENLPFLKLLQVTESEDQHQALLDTATPSQIRALTEICHNTLYNHCKLDRRTRKKLHKNKKLLRKVADPSKRFKSKRRYLSQSGRGIFTVLLPTIISAVSALLAK